MECFYLCAELYYKSQITFIVFKLWHSLIWHSLTDLLGTLKGVKIEILQIVIVVKGTLE